MFYSKTFSAFLEEASFTKEILAIGVTQLYKANYGTKGIYYQSFTCLSTGIERLEKLCLILDYYVQNKGVLPSESYIRNYGHKIPELYIACQKIAELQKINFHFCYKMDSNIHHSIINLLGHFADTSGRYSNVNILLGKENASNDCIEEWFYSIDIPLYQKHISQKRKADIEHRASLIGNILNPVSILVYTFFTRMFDLCSFLQRSIVLLSLNHRRQPTISRADPAVIPIADEISPDESF